MDETPSPTRDDVMDSRGLLQFETLHEMNTNATIAFRDNPLFGTYAAGPIAEENVLKDKGEGEGEGKGKFVWMTYGEYGDLVNRCRTVLRDIGEWAGLVEWDYGEGRFGVHDGGVKMTFARVRVRDYSLSSSRSSR
jgi:hypothetical protein